MISAEELRNIPKNKTKKENFFDKIKLKRIERIIKKNHKYENTGVSIGVIGKRDIILEILKEKGYVAYYWRSKWSNGMRLIISWDK